MSSSTLNASTLRNLIASPVTREEIIAAVVTTRRHQKQTVRSHKGISQYKAPYLKNGCDDWYHNNGIDVLYTIADRIIIQALNHFARNGIYSTYTYHSTCTLRDIYRLDEANIVQRLLKEFCPDWSVRLVWKNHPVTNKTEEFWASIPNIVIQIPF